jgi:hypothetical protein
VGSAMIFAVAASGDLSPDPCGKLGRDPPGAADSRRSAHANLSSGKCSRLAATAIVTANAGVAFPARDRIECGST